MHGRMWRHSLLLHPKCGGIASFCTGKYLLHYSVCTFYDTFATASPRAVKVFPLMSGVTPSRCRFNIDRSMFRTSDALRMLANVSPVSLHRTTMPGCPRRSRLWMMSWLFSRCGFHEIGAIIRTEALRDIVLYAMTPAPAPAPTARPTPSPRYTRLLRTKWSLNSLVLIVVPFQLSVGLACPHWGSNPGPAD